MRPMENHLKTLIRDGRQAFGMWLESGDAAIVEIAGMVGLDFVIIDQEHGIGGLETAIDAMRALSGSRTTAMIRVPSDDPIYLKRLLDAGAQALLVPMVDTAEQARALVDACRYPPLGRRGNAAPVVRGSGYGLIADYVQHAHENLLIVPQVESATAVANAGAIAAVDGVDMVFIGPADLSGSIGIPDQTGAPEVERLIAETVAAVRAAGKPLATCPRDGKTWQQLFDEGYAFIAAGSDLAMFRIAALEQAKAWHAFRDGGASRAAALPAAGRQTSY